MTQTMIIDYGSGNLHSAAKAFERAAREAELNMNILVSADPKDVRASDRIVLPGVGAYGDCYDGLDAIPGMHEALDDMVIKAARPFLGICVGMQLMSTEGHEYRINPGLDWIAGKVVPIEPSDSSLKIPHMGWNTLKLHESRDGSLTNPPHPLLEGISLGVDGLHAYFVHSYHFVPKDEQHIICETDYGGPVTAMIGRDNLVGTQFHPEKSQKLGLRLISNFLKWDV